MRNYLLLDTNGDGIGFVTGSERIRPGVAKELALELRTISDEDRQRIQENPHYFAYKGGKLLEYSDVMKKKKDKEIQDRLPKKTPSILLQKIDALEKRIVQLEAKK
jgi:hypothetical protein